MPTENFRVSLVAEGVRARLVNVVDDKITAQGLHVDSGEFFPYKDCLQHSGASTAEGSLVQWILNAALFRQLFLMRLADEWEQIRDRVPQRLRDFSKRERAEAATTSRQATPCQHCADLHTEGGGGGALRCAALADKAATVPELWEQLVVA